MKNKFLKFALSFIIIIAVMSFTYHVDKKVVNVENSTVNWKGYKVTGFHEGPITMKEGFFTFENDKLTGGEFIIDMTSIYVTDAKGFIRKRIINHLKSDDFFSVKNHPTSKLVITNTDDLGNGSYKVTGEFTIKGITHPSTFNLKITENKANASLKLDRTKYDLKYRSGSFFDNLGNKMIHDEFDIVVDLEFQH